MGEAIIIVNAWAEKTRPANSSMLKLVVEPYALGAGGEDHVQHALSDPIGEDDDHSHHPSFHRHIANIRDRY